MPWSFEWFFPSDFPTKTFYTFLSSPMHATSPIHPILLNLICLIIGDKYKLWTSPLCNYLHSTWIETLSNTPVRRLWLVKEWLRTTKYDNLFYMIYICSWGVKPCYVIEARFVQVDTLIITHVCMCSALWVKCEWSLWVHSKYWLGLVLVNNVS
jgi:hypothetical protein